MPDDSEDDTQSDSSEMDGFVEHTCSYEVLFVPFQYKASSEFRYI